MTNKSAQRKNKAKNNKNKQGIVNGSENPKSITIKQVENGNIENNENTEKKPVVSPCNITLAGLCAVCWQEALYYCTKCSLVGYCCMSHMAIHSSKHDALCNVVTRKLVENEGDIFY